MLKSRASQGPFEGGRRSSPGGQQLVPSGSLTRPHHPPEQTETRHLDLTGSDIRPGAGLILRCRTRGFAMPGEGAD